MKIIEQIIGLLLVMVVSPPAQRHFTQVPSDGPPKAPVAEQFFGYFSGFV